jgi:hypothetical protein
LTQIHGKPVSCVVDVSPIEAWGKVLVQLGLIDEIICETALDMVKSQREESLQKAREKIQYAVDHPGSNTKPPKAAADRSAGDHENGVASGTSRASSPANSLTPSSVQNGIGGGSPNDDQKDPESPSDSADQDDDKELPSERELHLIRRAAELQEDLDEVVKDNQKAALALADARIALLGPCLCNPFRLDESSKAQQISWITTAVKKEKMRMGSTGTCVFPAASTRRTLQPSCLESPLSLTHINCSR